MWNVKTKAITVTTGSTGTVSKSLRQYLSNLPGKHEIKEPQKNSHIAHCNTYCGKCYCESTEHMSREK